MTKLTLESRVGKAVAAFNVCMEAEKQLDAARLALKKRTEKLTPEQRIEYFKRTGRDRYGAKKNEKS